MRRSVAPGSAFARGRWRLVGLLVPPFRPLGRAFPLVLGVVFALTWSTPPRQPAALEIYPGAAAVLAQPRDVRFGLNQAWEAPDQADLAGAGWSRLVFWWSSFQPRGARDFNQFATDRDSYIDDELARGRELSAVILNTPGWASADGSPNAVPRNLYLSWDDPENYWGQFMRRLAERYRGRIDSWIIWNEVDIRDGQWRTWDGSVDDYVQLLRVAYRAIKAGNPEATVVLFGSPWWHDKGAYLSEVLDGLAAAEDGAGWNHYFDVANLHMYSRANDIPEVISWYRAQLAARGLGDKPIWIGETNVVPYDDPLWPELKAGFRASLDEQSSYLIEAFATYLALGVQRIGVNRAVVVSKYGEAREVLAEGGRYRLDLEPATANSNETDPGDYVVGGNPVILVERADGDVARAYRPLAISPRPAPGARVRAELAWTP